MILFHLVLVNTTTVHIKTSKSTGNWDIPSELEGLNVRKSDMSEYRVHTM